MRLQIVGFATVDFNEAQTFAAICLTDSGKEIQLFAWSVRIACEKVFPVLDWNDMIGKQIRIAKKGVAATIVAIP